MAKVILICGRLCSGKSTYAGKLRKEQKAVILSVDEVMLAILDPYLGERHDEYAYRTQKFLFDKSLDLIEAGVNVILDWGFWKKSARAAAAEFYKSRNIECEFHYLDISDEVWKQRIEKRNNLVSSGSSDAYFVDENLAEKFESLFEKPDRNEINIWIEQ